MGEAYITTTPVVNPHCTVYCSTIVVRVGKIMATQHCLLLQTSTGSSAAIVHSKRSSQTIPRGTIVERTARNNYVYHEQKFEPSRPSVRWHIVGNADCKTLSQREFALLWPIREEEARYQVYATNRLKWGYTE